MSWFRRKRDAAPEPSPPADPEIDPDLLARVRATIHELAIPCVDISPGPGATSTTASKAGGHPYLPAGQDWPVLEGEPAIFVCQVNFADVPPLPDFPQSGLLQWFISAEGSYGRTIHHTVGRIGLEVRWYDDLATPSAQPVDAAPPTPRGGVGDFGNRVPSGAAMAFTRSRCLPAWVELSDQQRGDPIWLELATAHGEEAEDLEFTYEEYVRGFSSPDETLVRGSRIGGSPRFLNGDPRGSACWPPADAPDGRLLIELESLEFGGWGDAGLGHLFGNPAEVASGDLRSVTFHWDD